jgi:phytoene synthase
VTTDPALAAAYEHCRRIHAAHGRTYYLATRLLPAAVRPHVWALYAFARTADEIVDSPSGHDPRALPEWARTAMRTLRAPEPPHPLIDPLLAATWSTMRSYALDPTLVEEFLASMTMDLTVSRYHTWGDLLSYMRGSAAVIGELMAPILGASGPEALQRAGALGEAFQLTNFIRDVSEDFHRGRIYLPLEDLRTHDVSEGLLEAAIRSTRPDARVRALVAFEVDRARKLYAEAEPGLVLVADSSRPCLEAAYRLYGGILDEVVRHDHNVFAGRVHVPTRRRLATAASLAGRRAVRDLVQRRP